MVPKYFQPFQRPPRRRRSGPYILSFLLVACLFLPPAMAGQLDLDERLDLALQDAPLPVVLQSMAQILGADLDLDPTIDGKVTVEARSERWQDLLDQLCRTHELSCEVIPQQPPVLRIRPTDGQPGYHLETGLVELLDVVLEGAELRSTLEVFAQMADRAIDVHPDVEGQVSLTLRRTPWALALQLACEINRCRVLWQDPLRVVPLEAGDSPPRFNLSLQQARRAKALQTATTLPTFLPWTPLDLEIDPAVAGTVDVHLNDASVVDILDALCAPPSCHWQLVYGAPSVLQIRPGGAESAGPMAVHPPRGQEPLHLGLTQGAHSATAWGLRFDWSNPHQTLGLSATADLVLAWLPLRPERQLLLPLVRPCDGSSRQLLEPISLPMEGSVERVLNDHALRFLPGAGSGSPPAASCPQPTQGELRVTWTPSSPPDAEGQQRGPQVTDPSSEHRLAASAGRSLILRGTSEDSSAHGLVVVSDADLSPAGPSTMDLWIASLHHTDWSSRRLTLSPESPRRVVLEDGGELVLVYRLGTIRNR